MFKQQEACSKDIMLLKFLELLLSNVHSNDRLGASGDMVKNAIHDFEGDHIDTARNLEIILH